VDLPPLVDIAVVVTGALAAGFVNGLTGTGYALVALGFWLHAMSPATAAPLAALCAVGGHVQSLPRIWRGTMWPRLWPFLAAGMVGVPIGTALLERIAVQPLKLGIGLLLVAYCCWVAFVRRPPIVTGGGRLADAAIGLIGGVLGGMASLSGPAPAVWAQLRGWTMHEQRGVNQPFNMTVLIVAVLSAAVAGLIVAPRLGRHHAALDSDRCTAWPADLQPAERPAVQPHRAGAAGTLRRHADSLVAGLKLKTFAACGKDQASQRRQPAVARISSRPAVPLAAVYLRRISASERAWYFCGSCDQDLPPSMTSKLLSPLSMAAELAADQGRKRAPLLRRATSGLPTSRLERTFRLG
jgi:uncharacterized membrane protein YfcA